MPNSGAGLTIVHYHRFHHDRAGEQLRAQCVHLRKEYDILPLDEATRRLSTHPHSPDKLLVVCVDDGHHDFHSVGWPVFREFGIRPICYLVTDFVDGTDWLWCDKVAYLCRNATRPRIAVDVPEMGRVVLPLTTVTDRVRVLRLLKHCLKALPNDERVAVLRQLPHALGSSLPEHPPDEYRAVSWDDVRAMRKSGVLFGPHTRTHPILSRLPEADMVREIVDSKTRLESELDSPALHFCYPNGRSEDIGERTPEIVRALGFETAVTTVMGVNDSATDRMKLRRIWLEPDLAPAQFRCRLSGVPAVSGHPA